jgi:hypothetical protein
MKPKRSVLVLVLMASSVLLRAQPLGTSFTYQGRLADAGVPANGSYDLELRLFDAPAGGTALGTVLRDDVVVADGLFTVRVDFGPAFTGSLRWLEIGVRPGASTGPFTTLGLRQELSPAPHAMFGATAPWAGITGKPAGFADDVDDDSGTITGVTAGAGLTGGGTVGAVTLGADFAGPGSASTVARSDHHHFGGSWAGSGGFGLQVINVAPTGFASGVQGVSASNLGRGVFGQASSAVGAAHGVMGQSDSTGGAGVLGTATATSGLTYGVWGLNASTDGRGVFGRATSATGATSGVWGEALSPSGRGVFGNATASTGSPVGVHGQSAGPTGAGVSGLATAVGPTAPPNPVPAGVRGRADFGNGVEALSDNHVGLLADGFGAGVIAYNRDDGGGGVIGVAESEIPGSLATAIVGLGGGNNRAGLFSGNVEVFGTLSKTAGSFVIDHPLDPANKYLVHSFVESPDMKNVYDGVATLDARGEAVVELPDWFEALNGDFRYQLTAIGAPAPGLHVAAKVAGNRFRIGGGPPGLEVSWQVTGIRQDAYARAHRLAVEVDKPEGKRGTYRHPVEHGASKDQGEDRALRALARRPVTSEP